MNFPAQLQRAPVKRSLLLHAHSDHPLGTPPGFQAEISSVLRFLCRAVIFSGLLLRPGLHYRGRQHCPKHHHWSYELDSYNLRHQNHQTFMALPDLLSEPLIYRDLHKILPRGGESIFSPTDLGMRPHFFCKQQMRTLPGETSLDTYALNSIDSH